MFDPTSRYYSIDTATLATPDGRVIAYKRRRFVPDGASLPVLVEVTVVECDRLDLIAARTIGSGEQFWRICDANNAMVPDDLTSEPGGVIRVPVPQPDLPG